MIEGTKVCGFSRKEQYTYLLTSWKRASVPDELYRIVVEERGDFQIVRASNSW